MAGVAIAVRMYQVDRGRRPDTLRDLVPDYLAAVPQDPMDEPGRPIRYINDPEIPLLYSVGRDGRDDGGNYDELAEGTSVCKDLPFFLGVRPSMLNEEKDRNASDDADSDN